jgi:hypothetical protein
MWLQPGVRLMGEACSAPRPDSQASGVRSPPGRASSLTLGSYRLQPPIMPPPTVQSTLKALTVYSMLATVQNNAIHSEFTHNEEYYVLQ